MASWRCSITVASAPGRRSTQRRTSARTISNEVAIRLALHAVEMFENAAVELGGLAGCVRDGYLVLAPHRQEGAIERAVPLQQTVGVETSMLAAAEIAERPELALEVIGPGCYEPASGYADSILTVRSLSSSAQANGLAVHEGRAVTGIKRRNANVVGVETSRGDIDTPVVVNTTARGATGSRGWSVSSTAGLQPRARGPIELPSDSATFRSVSDAAQRLYFRRHRKGRILVGQGWPKHVKPADPDTYDRSAARRAVAEMADKLLRRLPALRGRLRAQAANTSPARSEN